MNLSEKKQYLSLAEDYFRSNNYPFAEQILKTIIKAEPDNSKANELLAYIYGNQGNSDLSYQLLERASNSKHCSAEALYYLGAAQLARQLYEPASGSFKKSIAKAGPYFEALHDLGTAYGLMGQLPEALTCYQDCLRFNPHSHELHFNIGRCFDALKRYEEALDSYDRAIQFKPDYAQAWLNKGVTLHDLRRYQAALDAYDRAIQCKPDDAQVWSNKGNTLHQLMRFSDALYHHNRAIELNPDYFDAYFNKAATHLLLGEFGPGWDLYSYRWQGKDAPRYRYPQCKELESVSDIQNKRILIWHEQGLGDTIQFARYIPRLVELGAQVTFEVQEPLRKLFTLPQGSAVVSNVEDLLAFDFQLPLLSLPKLFNTTMDSIPKPIDIQFDAKKIRHWSDRLRLSETRLNIGVAISGNPSHKNDQNRSMALKDLEPLLDCGQIFILQKDLNPQDAKYLRQQEHIIHLGNDIVDFADTAAIIRQMDLVISVDSALIHLAGSLNQTAFLALPWCPEWRWLLDRADTPWYPSVRVFRQPSPMNWEFMINQMKHQLPNKRISSSP